MQVALVGNPNTGKSSIFNALTGLRQKVSNYPGVTVEKKTGYLKADKKIEIVDLPGLYSLTPKSLDDKIATDVLLGIDKEIQIQAVIVVVDASNINRNLYLVTQVLDLDLPVILALNMMDSAERKGIEIDAEGLSREFSIPIIPVVANKKRGIDELKNHIIKAVQSPDQNIQKRLIIPQKVKDNLLDFHSCLQELSLDKSLLNNSAAALRIISNDIAGRFYFDTVTDEQERKIKDRIDNIRTKLISNGSHWSMLETKLRYEWIDRILQKYIVITKEDHNSFSYKLDKILTNRFVGPAIFLIVFALIFQTIFSWAELPMELIETSVNWFGQQIANFLPAGILQSMIVDGAIAGVGSILVFLPQILFLFFFLTLLEDSGYLSRVAFMLDRIMRIMGLTGRSVIPLLSSLACAIPGIMATRTIQNWKDRLITIMVAPFMSCSARLPVYILMIGAFIPDGSVFGFISYSTITLLAMYTIGILAAVFVAFIFRKFLVKKSTPDISFVMELPPYQRPSLRWTALQMYERAKIFVQDAGKIILAMSIVLWFLASYPVVENTEEVTASKQIENSYAGKIGKAIEPAIEPLGFDWKIGIGLLTSFAAREVMVSTMATIYNVEGGDETSVNLKTALQNDVNPVTGERTYSTLTAISLMVFFVLACQCMATVAIVKRETNSWRWPLLMIAYMTFLAYFGSLIVFQGGKMLGF
jgi:ferrous iron transport protein B